MAVGFDYQRIAVVAPELPDYVPFPVFAMALILMSVNTLAMYTKETSI